MAEEPFGTPDTRPAGEKAALLQPGSIVAGQYRVERMLGAGGMGTIYGAVQLDLDRPVALKVVRGELLNEPKVLRRFRREALTIARLRHPHVVTVYDYDVDENVGAYFVMELLEGCSLREELEGRGRLPAGEAVELMKQICAGVGAAHRVGVTHRDLKPANIFLERATHGTTPAPSAKVLDFGLARVEERYASRALTTGGMLMGTPVYMSPEQCQGEEADARSDVYALGSVLYEMLTGRPPFLGERLVTIVYRHVTESPMPPGDLVPGITPALNAAVLCALSKAPDNRFQTAADFGAALEAACTIGLNTGVFEAVTVERPAVTSTGWPAGQERMPDNLPHAMTQFVGRARQVEEVRKSLSRKRLVTLVGPGGIGKTRLALAVAASMASAYDVGVRLIEFAALTDAALVPRAVAAALGLRDESIGSAPETLAKWLGARRVLLVLDNCEHLVEACAQLAEALLHRCPNLRVLATSREPLGVAGETVWPVPPLPVPDPADPAIAERLPEYGATALFLDRAPLNRPDFAAGPHNARAIAEICRRLEGIPLAIELAAARVKTLSVDQILARLEDRFRLLVRGSRTAPSRQQTLRATLDWSYELLTEEERALLQRLSVFAGGWTLEAAEAAIRSAECSPIGGLKAEWKTAHLDECSTSGIHHSARQLASIQHSDVLQHLERLVDKSFVVVHDERREARYGMLETIREYALEHLRAGGEEDVTRRRHVEYFLTLAETAGPELKGPRGAEALDRLETEHDNLRAALGWAHERDPDACLRLAAAAHYLWIAHGHLREGLRWLEAALKRSTTVPPRIRMQALSGAGDLAIFQGQMEVSREYYEENLRIAMVTGEKTRIALSYGRFGIMAVEEGDLRGARAHFGKSLAIAEEMGHGLEMANALNALGEVARLEGELAEARDFYERSLAIARQLGLRDPVSAGLANLGAIALEEGDLQTARGCYLETLAIAREVGSKDSLANSLDGLAAEATKRGTWARAAQLAAAAEALREASGYAMDKADRVFRERYMAELRERLDETALDRALAEGRAMTLEQAVSLALEEPEA